MLNGVNINYLILVLVTGSILLAAIYHTILFVHRRISLLAFYSIYLWITLLYVGFRFFYPSTNDADYVLTFLNPDETLQMFSFMAYIIFMDKALVLQAHEKRAKTFAKIAPFVIFFYILFQIANVNFFYSDKVYLFSKFLIRLFLISLSAYLLLSVVLKRKQLYYYYLAAGAIAILFFGVISSIASFLRDAYQQSYYIGSLSWMMIGFFSEVIFFSSAIGYKLKLEADEKEAALLEILKQQENLKAKEIEKIEAVFETKANERMRIATDLHDSIGASISSIGMYAEVARQRTSKLQSPLEPLQKISETIGYVMDDLKDTIWVIMPQSQDFTSVVERLRQYAEPLCSERNIQFQIRYQPASKLNALDMFDKKGIYLICKEAINNALKYSNGTKITLEIVVVEQEAQVLISDNGSGFNLQDVTGNGLQNMRERAKKLGGSIYFNTQNETTIQLKFPISNHNSP
jgi:signal transduction histidine kinase